MDPSQNLVSIYSQVVRFNYSHFQLGPLTALYTNQVRLGHLSAAAPSVSRRLALKRNYLGLRRRDARPAPDSSSSPVTQRPSSRQLPLPRPVSALTRRHLNVNIRNADGSSKSWRWRASRLMHDSVAPFLPRLLISSFSSPPLLAGPTTCRIVPVVFFLSYSCTSAGLTGTSIVVSHLCHYRSLRLLLYLIFGLGTFLVSIFIPS
jgi:hypothetical protein